MKLFRLRTFDVQRLGWINPGCHCLAETILDLLQDPTFLPQAPGPLVGIDKAAQVDPSALIRAPVRIAAGAIIEAGAVVGPLVVVCGGGRVAAGAEITRSVVWPGATANGKNVGTVVMPDSVYLAETTPEPVELSPAASS